MTAPFPSQITVEFDIQPARAGGQCHLCDAVISPEYPAYMMIVTIKNQVTIFRFCQEHFNEFAAEMDNCLMGYAEWLKLKEEMK